MFSQKIIILMLLLYSTETPTKKYFIPEILQPFNPIFIYIQNYKLTFSKTDDQKFVFYRFFGVLDHCALIEKNEILFFDSFTKIVKILCFKKHIFFPKGKVFDRYAYQPFPVRPSLHDVMQKNIVSHALQNKQIKTPKHYLKHLCTYEAQYVYVCLCK